MTRRDLLRRLGASLAGARASARDAVPKDEPSGFTGFCPPLPEYLCER